MKTLIISITLGLAAALLSAQEVTVLDATRLVYAPVNTLITEEGDSYVYEVKEDFSREFARDPIGFMNANFDIQKFMSYTAHKNYDSYLVTFKCTNGSLQADFDKNGKLIRTFQRFNNVILPVDIRNEIFSDYKGYTLTKAKYTARTNGEVLAKATYKIGLDNGEERHNLKIDATRSGVGVALN